MAEDYTDVATVRAMQDLSDEDVYPDVTLLEAIEYAEELIDRETHTSWVYKTFTVTLDGSGTGSMRLVDEEGYPILNPRTLTAVTIDGVALDSADWSGWRLYPTGKIVRDSGSFAATAPGGNVTIAGTAGLTSTAPKDIAWCARTLARQYAIDLQSNIPERAMSVQGEFGNVQLAQATNNPDRPTSLPEVNARLIRRRQYLDLF